MSFSLSRVPKRVALTALQGLVVGTSCTLLFVCEDRRRRIDQARRAIHNAERIRAAKQYRKKPPPEKEEEEEEQALSTTLLDTTVAGRTRPPTRVQKTNEPRSSTSPPPLTGDPYAHTKQRIRHIKEAVALGDAHSLDVGLWTLTRIARQPDAVGPDDQPKLVQAAVGLYRKYNEAGSTEQAVRVLEYLSRIGPVSSADFYTLSRDHVERALAKLDAARTQPAAMHRLDRLLRLLVPPGQEGTVPPARTWEWSSQAERAIRLALARGGKGVTKSEAFVRLVQTFAQRQGTLSHDADPAVWTTMGHVLSEAAQLGATPDPAASLVYLAAACPPGRSLKTVWVMKLLTVDWQQCNLHKDLSQTLRLFARFEALGGCDKVAHVDGVYRVLLELALDAHEWSVADEFLAKLTARHPDAADDPKIIGLLAKTKAKLGDWAGVWHDLERMDGTHVGDVFVPILKAFSKTHTVREVDELLRRALDQWRVPITPYLVTLVGNRYGELRDVASLVTWLEFCLRQGVQVDAAFANTILRNGRRHWDFDYQALKRVYRTLQRLHPGFVDEVTHHMMVSAALTATRRAASPLLLHREVTSLAIRFRTKSRPSDPHDLRLWMRRAFALRNYRLVQNMYEKAHKQGARLDDGHLLLHVRAILLHTANLPKIVRVLQEAKQQEISVERATAHVVTYYVRRVFDRDLVDKDVVLRHVQGVLSQLQAAALQVSWSSLLRTAYLCLTKIHHMEAALNFAQSALHLKRVACPDDVPTVQVFLLAYTAKTDLDGLRWTIRGASEAGLLHKERVMEALRSARRSLLERHVQTLPVQEAIQLLDKALHVMYAHRRDLSAQRQHMEQTTIEMMAQAASHVGLPPGARHGQPLLVDRSTIK